MGLAQGFDAIDIGVSANAIRLCEPCEFGLKFCCWWVTRHGLAEIEKRAVALTLAAPSSWLQQWVGLQQTKRVERRENS